MNLSILYIASRERSYTRNEKMINALKSFCDLKVICLEDSVTTGGEAKLRYLLRIFKVLINYYFTLIKNYRKYDILFIGFSAQLLFPFVRPFWRKKVVTDLYVSLYDTLCFDKKLLKPNSIKGRLVKWLDKICINGSDIILMDTNEHAKYIETTFKTPPGKVKSVFVGSRLVNSSYNFKKQDTFHIVFTGSYIPLQGTTIIIEAAKLIKDLNIKITMVGQGQEYPKAHELAAKYELKNVEFIGWVSFIELDKWISTTDLILGIFGDTNKAKRVIPNKIFEPASIGKPILTGDSPAIREIFTPDKDILVTRMNDPEALAEKIRWAFNNKNKLVKIGHNGNESFQKYASDEKISNRLEIIINNLR